MVFYITTLSVAIYIIPSFFVRNFHALGFTVDADESPFAIFLLISMFAYVSARLVLLVLALALLRDLPPNAYIAVDWTKFYPHIL